MKRTPLVQLRLKETVSFMDFHLHGNKGVVTKFLISF